VRSDCSRRATTAAQIRALKAVDYIGRQYEHLARYAEQLGLEGLELSVHRDDRAYLFLRQAVPRVPTSDGGAYWTLVDARQTAIFCCFVPFVFRFLSSKLDMERAAAEHGFSALMNQTWFCHKPLAGDMPCGRCRPCGYAMTEGMARRLPWTSRLKYYARQARKRFKLGTCRKISFTGTKGPLLTRLET
jgi:hypothetical protein